MHAYANNTKKKRYSLPRIPLNPQCLLMAITVLALIMTISFHMWMGSTSQQKHIDVSSSKHVDMQGSDEAEGSTTEDPSPPTASPEDVPRGEDDNSQPEVPEQRTAGEESPAPPQQREELEGLGDNKPTAIDSPTSEDEKEVTTQPQTIKHEVAEQNDTEAVAVESNDEEVDPTEAPKRTTKAPPTPPPTEKSLGAAMQLTCSIWRQTGGCRADGERQRHLDAPCSTPIKNGRSGYCECWDADGATMVRVAKVGCVHEPFTCQEACREGPDFMTDRWEKKNAVPDENHGCVAFRETENCEPVGEYDPAKSRGCHEVIPGGVSGFCDCLQDAVPGFDIDSAGHAFTCDHPPIVCAEVCQERGDLNGVPGDEENLGAPEEDEDGDEEKEIERAAVEAAPKEQGIKPTEYCVQPNATEKATVDPQSIPDDEGDDGDEDAVESAEG